MLAKLFSCIGGNCPPPAGAAGFLPLWLFVQATTCGVKACLLLVAVVVVGCCCVFVLELTWTVVARITAPLPCKNPIAHSFVMDCVSIVSRLSSVNCQSLVHSQLYCFPLAIVTRLKALISAQHCAGHCGPCTPLLLYT